jgi:hypothetical protein
VYQFSKKGTLREADTSVTAYCGGTQLYCGDYNKNVGPKCNTTQFAVGP